MTVMINDNDASCADGDARPITMMSLILSVSYLVYNQFCGMDVATVPDSLFDIFATGTIGKILMSFSVPHNASKILATDRLPGSLDAVHGIRFISMSWVILGHTYLFVLGATCEYLGHSGSHLPLCTISYL